MNILLVADHYWPEVGAAPSRLSNMAEALHEQGCEVDVLTCLPNYPKGRIFSGYKGRFLKKEQHNGVNIFRYWVFAALSKNPVVRILNMFSFATTLWCFAFRRKQIKQYDGIIIQSPNLVVATSAMILFKKVFHKKSILNISDLWPSSAVDMGAIKEGNASYNFLKRLELFLYRNADAILGQSREILCHVAQCTNDKPLFLYRNLQHYQINKQRDSKHKPLRIVFCGLLGIAQDVLGIVKNVPFRQLGAEFHIVGGGIQGKEITDYIASHPDCNVIAHGFVAKEKVPEILKDMDASIVPLKTYIRGAVPSKLYDILPMGIPVLFNGEGEGAQMVSSNHVGYVSAPGDYKALGKDIERMASLSDNEYKLLSQRCIDLSLREFDFNKQIKETTAFLKAIYSK